MLGFSIRISSLKPALISLSSTERENGDVEIIKTVKIVKNISLFFETKLSEYMAVNDLIMISVDIIIINTIYIKITN